MKNEKKHGTLRRRLMSLLTLALILIPMGVLVVYAGSESKEFIFNFGTSAATDSSRAYKSDVGSSSGYYFTGSLSRNTYVDLIGIVNSGVPYSCSGIWWP